MSASDVDRDPSHLFPPFRTRLLALMADLERETGEPWIIEEGLRSQARQSWLYAQGRTRPGPIVTWMKTPTWHGTGLAADIRPRRGYDCPPEWWKIKHRLEPKHGLKNPPYRKGDLGHVQIADESLRPAAVAWVNAGFPETPDKRHPITVTVNGIVVPDAEGYEAGGASFAWVRPVATALHASIDPPRNGTIAVTRGSEMRDLDCHVEDGRAMVALHEWTKFPGIMLHWTPGAVEIST